VLSLKNTSARKKDAEFQKYMAEYQKVFLAKNEAVVRNP
jgi:hypothetical protein